MPIEGLFERNRPRIRSVLGQRSRSDLLFELPGHRLKDHEEVVGVIVGIGLAPSSPKPPARRYVMVPGHPRAEHGLVKRLCATETRRYLKQIELLQIIIV